MSDGAKKRSRLWVGWVVLALLLAYPLSIGPAFRIASATGRKSRFDWVYRPIFYLTSRDQRVYGAVNWYCELWGTYLGI